MMTQPIPNNIVSQTWEKPFIRPDKIPSSADVVIIGGGIVGVSTAYFLAKAGINVVLCEKGHIAGEQSGRNWGWVRKQYRDARELPMMIESMKIWANLEQDIGEDVGFQQTGCIYAAKSEKQLAEYEDWLKTAKHFGLDTRLLSAAEIKNHISGASENWPGALHTPSDGRAEPHLAAPAIARAAVRAGATILTTCAVRGMELSAGRVSGVISEYGTIKAQQVLCAGGAWTSMFCRFHGIHLPQLKVKGIVARTEAREKLFDGELYGGGLGLRRRQDGGYTIASESYMNHSITPSTFRYALKFLPAFIAEIKHLNLTIGGDFFDELSIPVRWPMDTPSPFERTRVLNPDPDEPVLKSMAKAFTRLFPAFTDIKFAESWAGMIETTPDAVPVICESEKISGFYIATGFSGHGFGIGPGAGKAIAGMISGQDSGIDLSPFQLKRYFDGSKIILNQRI